MGPMERTVALDDLNLTQRVAYDLDFFFAERRCCGSSFRIETSIKPVIAECIIWGDPHISTFDHGVVGAATLAAFNNVYDSGDYWLLKNDAVWIQGRYGTTIWSRGGSAMLSLAIGGPFLQQGGRNHSLIIEPTDDGGMVTWDGEQIVKKAPAEFVIPGFLRVTYANDATHIDEGLKGVPVDTVRVYMPRRVNLRVNRWPKHIDAVIESPQQLYGQEGHCGNFNLDDSDDSLEQIAQRTGSLSGSASLFREQMLRKYVAEVLVRITVAGLKPCTTISLMHAS